MRFRKLTIDLCEQIASLSHYNDKSKTIGLIHFNSKVKMHYLIIIKSILIKLLKSILIIVIYPIENKAHNG